MICWVRRGKKQFHNSPAEFESLEISNKKNTFNSFTFSEESLDFLEVSRE
tara:strand:- start:957 stop:1106 length:150 start_codon:yes stop_codon:yes gene_type:complete